MGIQGSGIVARLGPTLASNSRSPSDETVIKALEKKKIFVSATALHPLCLSRTEKLARKLIQKLRTAKNLSEKEINQIIKELKFGEIFFAVDIGNGEIEIHLMDKRVVFAGQEDPQLRLEVQGWLEGPFDQAQEHFRARGYILSEREDGKMIVTFAPNEMLKAKGIYIDGSALKHPSAKKLVRELCEGLSQIPYPTQKKINQIIENLALNGIFFAADAGNRRIEIHLVDRRVKFSCREGLKVRYEVQRLLNKGKSLQEIDQHIRKWGYSIRESEGFLTIDISPVDILRNRKIVIDRNALQDSDINELSQRLLRIKKPTEDNVNHVIEKLSLQETLFAVETWNENRECFEIRICLIDKRIIFGRNIIVNPLVRWTLQHLLKLRDNEPNEDIKAEHFRSFKKTVYTNGHRISGHVQADNGFEQIFISKRKSKSFSFIKGVLDGIRTIGDPIDKSNAFFDLRNKIENSGLARSVKRMLYEEALEFARTHAHSHLKLSDIIGIADDMRSAGIAKGEVFKAYKEAFDIAAAMPSYLPKDGALRNLRFSLRAFGLDRGEIGKLFDEKGLELPE
ncbi:MAG: hypothetical protein V3T21_04275 [Candidatus Margulisiibacteriota bacterium]